MYIRSEWMSNSDISGDDFSKQLQIKEVKDRFEIQRYQSNEGCSVKIDDVIEQVVVQVYTNVINKNEGYLKLHCDLDSVVKTGSIVEYKNEKYIVVNAINNNEAYKSTRMMQCNNTLKFYKNHILFQVPCIVGKGNINMDENRFISITADEYILVCPNILDTSNIDLNTRFILTGSAYQVLGIDNISSVGLLNIRVKEDSIVEDDNLSLGIANYYSNQIVDGISILNASPIMLNVLGGTAQLLVECTRNSDLVVTPIVTYVSSNINVCEVSSSGLITCIGTGLSTITATYKGISVSIQVSGIVDVQDNYSVSISGVDYLKYNQVDDYTCEFSNNGSPVEINGYWSILADDGISSTNLASITSSNYDSCIVKANNNSQYGYVKLKAQNQSGGVYSMKRIRIKSLI